MVKAVNVKPRKRSCWTRVYVDIHQELMIRLASGARLKMATRHPAMLREPFTRQRLITIYRANICFTTVFVYIYMTDPSPAAHQSSN